MKSVFMNPRPPALRPLTCALLTIAALAGCAAHPDLLRVGMTRDELDARFGKPSAERHDGDDDVRIYTSAPLGQVASAAHIGPDGRVTAVEPLFNTEHFALIQVDRWSEADVLAHFGKPSEISGTRNYLVWGYRYREAGEWNSMFSVMFDKAGIVRQTQNGPDEMYDPEDHGQQ
jgi:hypothetical protein